MNEIFNGVTLPKSARPATSQRARSTKNALNERCSTWHYLSPPQLSQSDLQYEESYRSAGTAHTKRRKFMDITGKTASEAEFLSTIMLTGRSLVVPHQFEVGCRGFEEVGIAGSMSATSGRAAVDHFL